MKTYTYKKLMKMVDDGKAQVNAWAAVGYSDGTVADVTFFTGAGEWKERVEILVTKIPAEVSK